MAPVDLGQAEGQRPVPRDPARDLVARRRDRRRRDRRDRRCGSRPRSRSARPSSTSRGSGACSPSAALGTRARRAMTAAASPASDRVFVTGGSGFVGGALVGGSSTTAGTCCALARSQDAAEPRSRPRAPSRCAATSRAPRRSSPAMRGCGTVFHVAGVNATCVRDPSEMLHANIDGAAAVIRAAASAGVGRVVHTSSAATIGEQEGVGRARGLAAPRMVPLRLRALEVPGGAPRARARRRSSASTVVCVNPSSVQGPGRIGGSARLLIDLVNGKLPRARRHAPRRSSTSTTAPRRTCSPRRRGAPGRRYLRERRARSRRPRPCSSCCGTPAGGPKHARFAPALGDHVRGRGRRRGWRGSRGASCPCAPRSRAPCCTATATTARSPSVSSACVYTPIEETVRRTLAWYAERDLAPAPIAARRLRTTPAVG